MDKWVRTAKSKNFRITREGIYYILLTSNDGYTLMINNGPNKGFVKLTADTLMTSVREATNIIKAYEA